MAKYTINTIDSLDTDELRVYTLSSEVLLLRLYEPDLGVFIAESGMVINRALLAGYEPISFLVDTDCLIDEVVDILDRYPHIPVYGAPHDLLKSLTGYNITRGILSCMRRKAHISPTDLIYNAHRIAVLEDVENPTNVGAIFRSAAAMKMDAIILTGGCADPLYRRSLRVSVGTVFQIPWTIVPDPVTCMNTLKSCGYSLAALSLGENTTSILDPKLHSIEKLALILGNEGYGLPDKTIQAADMNVIIPMAEGIDSLNVAAASAVAFWELGNKK